MTRSPAPGPVRLQVGDRLFVAVPAERARAVAFVLAQGAEHMRQRDGVAGLDWLAVLLAQLRQVHAEVEHETEHAPRVPSSPARTGRDELPDESAWWAHDHVTVAEAVQLTGWTPGYLARLGRGGYGVKRAGAWHLDRQRLLARAARRDRVA